MKEARTIRKDRSKSWRHVCTRNAHLVGRVVFFMFLLPGKYII